MTRTTYLVVASYLLIALSGPMAWMTRNHASAQQPQHTYAGLLSQHSHEEVWGQSPYTVPCKDRVTGPSRVVSQFCAGENGDFTNARVDFFLETGVWPRDFPACEVRPLVNFKTHDVITRSCNQNLETGRDIHSCGGPEGDGYSMAMSYQSHATAHSRWYRYIRLQQFFHLCTEQPGEWDWSTVPLEWS